MLYFEGLKARGSCFDEPLQGDMPLEKALAIAIENMEYAYGETDATLARFQTVQYGIVHENEFLSVPYWQFFFCSPINVLDAYQVNVRATDGAILGKETAEKAFLKSLTFFRPGFSFCRKGGILFLAANPSGDVRASRGNIILICGRGCVNVQEEGGEAIC